MKKNLILILLAGVDVKEMSESQESFIRGQAILMLMRSIGKKKVERRVLKRFLKCLKRD